MLSRWVVGGVAVGLLGLSVPQPARAQCTPDVAELRLLAPIPVEDATYGLGVAIDGDTLAVGAPKDDTDGRSAGAVYVYELEASGWVLRQTLTSPLAGREIWFGASVAISGDTLLVGASYDSNAGPAVGAVYEFARTGDTWEFRGLLLPEVLLALSEFGAELALEADRAVVGAPGWDEFAEDSGAAFIFERVAGTWVQQATLRPDDPWVYDRFGLSVALSGDTVLVGCPFDDDRGRGSGSVYVYVNSFGWPRQAKLFASDADVETVFGIDLALDGDVAVIGGNDDQPVERAGAAYVFVRDMGIWSEEAKLQNLVPAEDARFGNSVAMRSGLLAIEAGGEGVVDLFSGADGQWVPLTRLETDLSAGGAAGTVVAVGGGHVAVGTYNDSVGEAESGSVTVFCDCDAGPELAFGLPLAVTDLRLAKAADGVELTWMSSAGSVSHDVAKDTLAALRRDGVAAPPCVATGLTESSHLDLQAAVPGGEYFLVQDVNACGPAPWGADSNGATRPACP